MVFQSEGGGRNESDIGFTAWGLKLGLKGPGLSPLLGLHWNRLKYSNCYISHVQSVPLPSKNENAKWLDCLSHPQKKFCGHRTEIWLPLRPHWIQCWYVSIHCKVLITLFLLPRLIWWKLTFNIHTWSNHKLELCASMKKMTPYSINTHLVVNFKLS